MKNSEHYTIFEPIKRSLVQIQKTIMNKLLFLFLLGFLSVVTTSQVYAQLVDSVIYTREPNRIIESFEQGINKAKLEEKGLSFTAISACQSNPNKEMNIIYTKSNDSIVSIDETDTTLTVKFMVSNSSYHTNWSTAITFKSDTLEVLFRAIRMPMSHREMFTSICLTIYFEKLNNTTIDSVKLNDRVFRKD